MEQIKLSSCRHYWKLELAGPYNEFWDILGKMRTHLSTIFGGVYEFGHLHSLAKNSLFLYSCYQLTKIARSQANKCSGANYRLYIKDKHSDLDEKVTH